MRRDLRDFLKLELIYQHFVCECEISFQLDLELARVPTSVFSMTDVGIQNLVMIPTYRRCLTLFSSKYLIVRNDKEMCK